MDTPDSFMSGGMQMPLHPPPIDRHQPMYARHEGFMVEADRRGYVMLGSEDDGKDNCECMRALGSVSEDVWNRKARTDGFNPDLSHHEQMARRMRNW
jgi:hypothetical protein